MAHPPSPQAVDVILSSGFLAFGRHIGFIEGFAEAPFTPRMVFGTSSGALVGALWCAGLSPGRMLEEVRAQRPIDRMRWSWTPWRGVFSLAPMIDHIAELLPPTFADLPLPLAVGVRTPSGAFSFVDSGPLAPAVAASCAIPVVFAPVDVELDGQPVPCADGGAVDRLGLTAWRGRPDRTDRAVVHLVERSAGPEGSDAMDDLWVVRSGRSGAGFWSLGDVEARVAQTRAAARAVLGGTPPAPTATDSSRKS